MWPTRVLALVSAEGPALWQFRPEKMCRGWIIHSYTESWKKMRVDHVAGAQRPRYILDTAGDAVHIEVVERKLQLRPMSVDPQPEDDSNNQQYDEPCVFFNEFENCTSIGSSLLWPASRLWDSCRCATCQLGSVATFQQIPRCFNCRGLGCASDGLESQFQVGVSRG